MQEFTTLAASSVSPTELNVILSEYVALDQARLFRRLFVFRFGLLAGAAALVSLVFPGLPVFARWFPPLACMGPPVAAWFRERHIARRLARRLDGAVVRKS